MWEDKVLSSGLVFCLMLLLIVSPIASRSLGSAVMVAKGFQTVDDERERNKIHRRYTLYGIALFDQTKIASKNINTIPQLGNNRAALFRGLFDAGHQTPGDTFPESQAGILNNPQEFKSVEHGLFSGTFVKNRALFLSPNFSLLPQKQSADPLQSLLSHSFQPLSKENKIFLRTGFKDYLNGQKEFKIGICSFRLERLSVHGNMFVSSGKIMVGSYLEAKSNTYLDMRSQHLQGDLKITIIKVPLVKQIRLLSRHFNFSSPLRDLHDPGLGRGFKFVVSDFDLGARRFYSFLELQIPSLLGQRGIVGSVFLNQFNGIGFNLFFDLPNIRFKDSPLKLRLPNYEIKSDK